MSQPGFELVGEASDGIEAVQKAKELRPELVILDLGLPKLNGLEAARRIRSISPAPEIVFLTASDCPETVAAALATGAKGFVVKFDAVTELHAAIESVLRGKEYVSKRVKRRGTYTSSHDPDTPTSRYDCGAAWHPLEY